MPQSGSLHVRWGKRVEGTRLCLYLLVGPLKNSVGLPQLHCQNPVSSLLIFVVVHWTLSLGRLSLCSQLPMGFPQNPLGQLHDHRSPVVLLSCSVQKRQPARLVLMSYQAAGPVTVSRYLQVTL